ncbi:hypothetical protein FCM35_KLT14469 [Carex littledalei]|uniref:Uncharacterized protein n=1 Tax=Carex littledalei TaxID=544730 RepID=A0A833QJQ8_9POAL|nr:hypothetical protein FCM35_KLT14469 [Carex littledalei]
MIFYQKVDKEDKDFNIMRDGKVCKGKHGYVKDHNTDMLMQEHTDVFYRNNLSPIKFVKHKGQEALLSAMQKLKEGQYLYSSLINYNCIIIL